LSKLKGGVSSLLLYWSTLLMAITTYPLKKKN